MMQLRRRVLGWWKNYVRKDFLQWFKRKYPSLVSPLRDQPFQIIRIIKHKEAVKDWTAARECVSRCANASWWEWDKGSRPLHWRWNENYQEIIRDGLPLWYQSTPPQYRKPQHCKPDLVTREAIKGKLSTVRQKGYIQPGKVSSLISFFAVPKGDSDIRMVYNGTQSGLNDSLWAPWFRLPTIEQHLRAVMPGTYMADLDIGEQFLNFILHEKTQVFAGVDLTSYFPAELTTGSTVLWERWTRCGMGFRSSPYQAVQGTLHAEEHIRGDPLDPTNPFHFDVVVLNLPGSVDYNPWKPWVFKMRSRDGRIACDLFIYVDDVRTTGPDDLETWQCT
jgi:hypothetical protein